MACAANVSEGRDTAVLARLARSCGPTLLDVHRDGLHHRAVLTMAGEDRDVQEAARALATEAVGSLDLRGHRGVHPRFGVLDVVPFTPLGWDGRHLTDAWHEVAQLERSGPSPADLAVEARDHFARWVADDLGVPSFVYGPLAGGTRSLPEIRRHAWESLVPDYGPPRPHPSAGSVAVGARPLMIAYNLWLEGVSLEVARAAATSLRAPGILALAFDLAGSVQLSFNLTDPLRVGPDAVYDAARALLATTAVDARIARAEVVGLVPAAVLEAVVPERRALLGLDPDTTIEARMGPGRLRTR
jgi:glutamate formiminotransferase